MESKPPEAGPTEQPGAVARIIPGKVPASKAPPSHPVAPRAPARAGHSRRLYTASLLSFFEHLPPLRRSPSDREGPREG